ncbi:MAG TPA: hypothetical protein VMM76_22895 [Pirellulaceae bacterium]|nr:hypothetical protein [Pirellulaceae bacterium]
MIVSDLRDASPRGETPLANTLENGNEVSGAPAIADGLWVVLAGF